MKWTMYAIYDTATEHYLRPFWLQNDGAAIRAFSDLAVSDENEIGKHVTDYSLVRLGTWDDTDGKVTASDKTTLITGLEAVAAAQKVARDTQLRLKIGEDDQ